MNRRWVVAGGGLLVFFLLLGSAVGLAVDALWFDELGYGEVFSTALTARLAVRAVAGLFMLAFFFVNLRLAAGSFGSIRRRISNIEIHEEIPGRYLNLMALAGAAFLSLLFSAAIGGSWLDILMWWHRESFGLVDPLNGRDVGFYVFELPVHRLIQSVLFLLVISVLVVLAVIYVTSGGLEITENRLRFRDAPLRHMVANVALLMLLLAWGYRLDLLELVFSDRSVVYGASFADVHAQVLGYRVLTALALAGFGVTVYDLFRRRYTLTLTAIGALILGAIVLKGLYPGAVQQFEVEPNEIVKEAPYIARNIAYTRRAFDLDAIVERPFDVNVLPAAEALAGAGETIRNIRLWDWRPLLDTYSQLQKLRLYYEFEDVDVDRYQLGGRPRQVMLAAREMDVGELAPNVQTWQNQHLIFTHGYGLVMSPVNEVTQEGLPVFYLSDIPPVSPDSLGEVLAVEQPEIYFGERTTNYVLVATRGQEFDYPQGDQNIYTSYTGSGGLEVDATWRRALFGWYLGSLKLLLTDGITPDSRLMLFRHIRQRVERIAPFLEYDADPYLVLLDGRLLWVIDAYTASDRYPYSEPVRLTGWPAINYIRNSVKVAVDAYHGSVTFYAWDEADPILRVYRSIFPDLFQPASSMPDGLMAHLRYPEDLFTIQAEVLRAYHMQDPRVFYNREDMWNTPNEISQGQTAQMEPYYVLLQLPDDARPSFQLVLPFTPARRDNMIALLVAKGDPENYGQRVIYEFPKDRLVFGPMQVEARIDQDPTISEQITLWSQKGSSVIRGNLLAIPIGTSVLYIEPLYLQAQQSQLPELRRVIAAYGTRIVMEPTLEDAMLALVGSSPRREAGAEAGPEAAGSEGSEGDVALSRQARAAYERAVAAQRRGDWAGYGEALEELGGLLETMAREDGDR
ncbi:MAG TPA: UPF0182 family protein [Gemmatimonadota bacterium]|nr:UPF0182 family protein [Gemmatimonadota bacterium]